jgi:hypothetical protein
MWNVCASREVKEDKLNKLFNSTAFQFKFNAFVTVFWAGVEKNLWDLRRESCYY